MDYFKELTAIVGLSNYAATGDERWLKVAASAAPKAESTAAAERSPRFQKQQAIEEQIMAFRPDFCEAAEILDALNGRLARRFCPMDYSGKEREALLEVFRAADAFRDALNKADDVVPQ